MCLPDGTSGGQRPDGRSGPGSTDHSGIRLSDDRRESAPDPHPHEPCVLRLRPVLRDAHRLHIHHAAGVRSAERGRVRILPASGGHGEQAHLRSEPRRDSHHVPLSSSDADAERTGSLLYVYGILRRGQHGLADADSLCAGGTGIYRPCLASVPETAGGNGQRYRILPDPETPVPYLHDPGMRPAAVSGFRSNERDGGHRCRLRLCADPGTDPSGRDPWILSGGSHYPEELPGHYAAVTHPLRDPDGTSGRHALRIPV